MLQESLDLRAEADEFHGFLQTLDEQAWGRPTGFKGWTPWDVVAHLHYFDRVSLLALQGEQAFVAKRDELIKAYSEGRANAEIARSEIGDLCPGELLEQWHTDNVDLAEQLLAEALVAEIIEQIETSGRRAAARTCRPGAPSILPRDSADP